MRKNSQLRAKGITRQWGGSLASIRGAFSLVGLAAAIALVPASARAAEPRIETPIASAAGADGVQASFVSLYAPLPIGTPGATPACDRIGYLRFRAADGPTVATQADAVAVLMPGLLEGATAFDPLARNAVREAARRGAALEVWAIDRRANCLEDLTGLDHLERTGDREAALAYYYGGAPLDGRTFAGFHSDDRLLAEIGVAQTVRDLQTILTRELPDQAWRERHVVCGGHSLGGPLIEAFAGWDFDSNRATTADAGYRQCAGFFGLDTLMASGISTELLRSLPGLSGLTRAFGRLIGQSATRSLRAGALSRRIELLGIAPETLALVEAVGYLATTAPGEDAGPWIARIPRSAELRTYYHLAGSANLARWLSSRDALDDLRFSFAGLFGQLLDDNTSPLGLVRASLGFPDGAPLVRNRLADDLALVPGLNVAIQRGRLVLPRRATGMLSGWRNYDALGSGTTQIGRGLTWPGSEVTDASTLARITFEGPTNLTESWFPTRIVTDLFALGAGDRSGTLAGALHPAPTRQRPRFTVMAGDGVLRKAGLGWTDPHVTLAGYEHLDVLTASERQNDGHPERSSQALVDFSQRVTTQDGP